MKNNMDLQAQSLTEPEKDNLDNDFLEDEKSRKPKGKKIKKMRSNYDR